MSKDSKIEWCDHTFNLVWGCIKVSPGCEHCYAESLAKRYGFKVWGPAKTTERRTMSAGYWTQPLRWNAAALKAGTRAKVFCSSMADVFEDHPTNNRERPRLWSLIEQTPALDWLLLTKRPENIEQMLPLDRWDRVPHNVWLGFSAEDQQRFDERWPFMETVKRKWYAPVTFCSAEPLLGPLNVVDALEEVDVGDEDRGPVWTATLDWVIAGGESGHGARSMSASWVRSLRDQCSAYEIAFHFKQWGEWLPFERALDAINENIYRAADGRRISVHDLMPYPHEIVWDKGVVRMGKHHAGRKLDGRTWDEYPMTAVEVH